MKKCGVIFNRHEWAVYLPGVRLEGNCDGAVRKCTKCGKLQNFDGAGYDCRGYGEYPEQKRRQDILTLVKAIKEEAPLPGKELLSPAERSDMLHDRAVLLTLLLNSVDQSWADEIRAEMVA